jgi:hypothetical protein
VSIDQSINRSIHLSIHLSIHPVLVQKLVYNNNKTAKQEESVGEKIILLASLASKMTLSHIISTVGTPQLHSALASTIYISLVEIIHSHWALSAHHHLLAAELRKTK